MAFVAAFVAESEAGEVFGAAPRTCRDAEFAALEKVARRHPAFSKLREDTVAFWTRAMAGLRVQLTEWGHGLFVDDMRLVHVRAGPAGPAL